MDIRLFLIYDTRPHPNTQTPQTLYLRGSADVKRYRRGREGGGGAENPRASDSVELTDVHISINSEPGRQGEESARPYLT